MVSSWISQDIIESHILFKTCSLVFIGQKTSQFENSLKVDI
jgi:hypothetical protein